MKGYCDSFVYHPQYRQIASVSLTEVDPKIWTGS
jgi:hypothetical protein